MSQPKTRSRALRAAALIIPICALSGCFLDNDVMDASCTPSGPDISLNSDCPFEQGRGPQVEPGTCNTKFDSPQSNAGWSDVFSIFINQNSGNCSSAACHGEEKSAANGIYLPDTDEAVFYKTLTSTNGTVGKLYVNPDNPLDSWIHCNVAGTDGGGLFMPKPAALPSEADAQIVEDWIHNNAPGPPM